MPSQAPRHNANRTKPARPRDVDRPKLPTATGGPRQEVAIPPRPPSRVRSYQLPLRNRHHSRTPMALYFQHKKFGPFEPGVNDP